MPKTLLVPLQVMLWLYAFTSPYCFESALVLPHGQHNKTGSYLPLNTQSLRMTSSVADLLKDQRNSRFFRGHGTHLTDEMPKTLLVPLQFSIGHQVKTIWLREVDRIGSLGEERRDGEIEGITARRLRLAAPPVTAASAALRLGTRRKPEHPFALYDGDEARLV
ncbi:hypothetical protein HPB50_024159 [Hyalomma asiaticum]|uniref:Uncharacterized protein n=1 Tax=Hyalomma asiaticum TaxID=266040 RepID=A0ACB7S2S8_HYAAI|nr:hypothetical protein HPB50_024159 [Hyalomma asiaticum]